jgi:tetratricopeptide (TPR) repeat protein
VGRDIIGIGLVTLIATLLALGFTASQNATWKDCELGAGDPDRSIPACSELLKRPSSRDHAAAFHNRGMAFAAKGKLDQAISDISAGIRLDPEPAYRWQDRGQLYARQGRYQQAVADFTEAMQRDPTPQAFRFQSRAEAYKGLGDLPHAIADYDEAIRLDPVAHSYRLRGNALRDAGQYDRALADYSTALRLEPTNTSILVDRGRMYARMGRSEAAKNDFDKALKLDPANEKKLRPVIEKEVAGRPPSTVAPLKTTSPPLAVRD